jgi:tetratricopeptide (TPR) repeat protein
MDAFDHYLRGNFELFRRTPASVTRAIAEFRAAAELDPHFTAARAREAYAYEIIVDWDWAYPGASAAELLDRAVRLSDEALAQDSASAEAWLAHAYGLVLQDRLHPARALLAFERALALDPSDAEAFHQYGQTLMSLGRYNEAVTAYHGALALDPTRAMTLVPLSAILTRKKDPEEARRWIDSAVAVGPEVPYAWSVRANLRNAGGDYLGATEDARRALAIDQSYEIPARSALAVAEAGLGRVREAEVELARAVDGVSDLSRPGSTDAFYIAMAMIALGREEDAVDLLDRVPESAWLWFYIQQPNFDPVRDHPRFRALERAVDPRPSPP